MPFPTQQFFDLNGKPCAGCLLYTYASGTSVPLATFTDYTGTVQNTNPIVLNGSGYPANGNTLVGVWLSPGVAYRVRLTLANNSQVYQLDGIVGPSPSFLVSAGAQSTVTVPFSVTPTFTAAGQVQLFRMTLTANVSNSSLVMTGIAAPSIVNFELTQDGVGGHTFVWPVNVLGAGTISAAANQTSLQQFLWDGTNAVATSPVQYGTTFQYPIYLSSQFVSGSVNPAQSGQVRLGKNDAVCWRNNANVADICLTFSGADGLFIPLEIPNAAVTGTVVNSLVKLTGAPSTLVETATTDVGGVVGICVGGCGTTGTPLVQQYGVVMCVFDAATVAGDYVQISSTVAGNCHDSGASYPNSGQVLGRVTSTNGAAGTYNVVLFGPEQQSTASQNKFTCQAFGSTVTSNTLTTPQVLNSCSFPSGALNLANKVFRLTTVVSVSPAGAFTSTINAGIGTSAGLGNYGGGGSLAVSTTSSGWNYAVDLTCVVTAPGATGQISCFPVANSTGTGSPVVGSQLFTGVNLTGVVWFGTAITFATGNVSNSAISTWQSIEQLN